MVGLEAVDLWVDVDAFDAAVDRGDLSAAITLYAGDLLLEDRFAPWTEPRREQLRVRHVRVLLARARELSKLGEWDASADLLERLIALDPLHEQAHAELMRVFARSGRRGLAEQVYQRLAARLRAELGVAPARSVQQAREDVLAARVEQARSRPDRSGRSEPVSPLPQERRLVAVLAVGYVADAALDAATELRRTAGGAVVYEQADALLAVFGAHAGGENDTAEALYAALALTRRLPGTVRVGVETGEAVIDLGPAGRIAGEPVDAAIRLRDAAPPGTVLTGPMAYRMAHEWFTFGRPRSGVVEARQLRGAARTPSRRPPRTRFVGRRAELGALVSLCTQTAFDGLPRLVTVVGVAGIGKSRLVTEALSRVPSGTTVLCARCPPRGLTGNYQDMAGRYTAGTDTVLGELLRAAVVQTVVGREADNVRFGLREGLHVLLGPLALPATVQRTTAAALCLSAGIASGGDNPLDGLRPAEVAEEIAHAWPRLATACARAGPSCSSSKTCIGRRRGCCRCLSASSAAAPAR
jgi:tetratricopeptide (TPR) repeat protein